MRNHLSELNILSKKGVILAFLGMFFISAAEAKVCFLPSQDCTMSPDVCFEEDGCEGGGGSGLGGGGGGCDCTGYNLSSATAESRQASGGYDCTACSCDSNKWKCTKKQCSCAGKQLAYGEYVYDAYGYDLYGTSYGYTCNTCQSGDETYRCCTSTGCPSGSSTSSSLPDGMDAKCALRVSNGSYSGGKTCYQTTYTDNSGCNKTMTEEKKGDGWEICTACRICNGSGSLSEWRYDCQPKSCPENSDIQANLSCGASGHYIKTIDDNHMSGDSFCYTCQCDTSQGKYSESECKSSNRYDCVSLPDSLSYRTCYQRVCDHNEGNYLNNCPNGWDCVTQGSCQHTLCNNNNGKYAEASMAKCTGTGADAGRYDCAQEAMGPCYQRVCDHSAGKYLNASNCQNNVLTDSSWQQCAKSGACYQGACKWDAKASCESANSGWDCGIVSGVLASGGGELNSCYHPICNHSAGEYADKAACESALGSCTDSTNANGCYTYQAPVITCNAAGHYYDSKNDCKQACNDCTTCSQVAQGTYTGCWTYPCSGDAPSSWDAEFYTENECYAAYPESGTCYYECVQNYISGCYNVEQYGSCSNPEPSTEIFIRYAYEQVNVPYGSHSGSGNLLGGSYTYASDARGGYYQLTGVDTSVNYTQWYAYINDNPASPVGITRDGIRYDVSGRNTIRICGMVQWAGANNLHNSIGMTALFVRKVGDAAGDVHFYMKGTGQNTCKFNSDAYVSGIGSCQFIEDVCYHSANGCATGAYTCNIDDMYQGGAPSASIWYHNRSILDGKARADWYSYCYDMPVTGGKSYVVNMAVATDNAPTCAQ